VAGNDGFWLQLFQPFYRGQKIADTGMDVAIPGESAQINVAGKYKSVFRQEKSAMAGTMARCVQGLQLDRTTVYYSAFFDGFIRHPGPIANGIQINGPHQVVSKQIEAKFMQVNFPAGCQSVVIFMHIYPGLRIVGI